MLKKAAVALLMLPLFFPAFTTASAQEKVVLDQVVALVGNSAIFYSEMDQLSKRIVQSRRAQGYTSDRNPHSEALEHLLLQKLLYNQAQIDSVEINKEHIASIVEEEIQEMIAEYGSLLRMEAAKHRAVFDIRKELTNQYEEESYAREMRSEVIDKVTITPGEVERFYKSLSKDSLPIIPEQYIYAHITKYPPSLKEAKLRVRQRLLEMRERILQGTRFEMLARMYSEEPGASMTGGEIGPMPLGGLTGTFASALEKLKPDQISEVVETEYGFHIIQMIEKNGDLYRARHILLRPIFTDAELLAADRQLDSLVRVIKSDSLTFEKAALQFSDDPYSRLNGGLVSTSDIMEMEGVMDAKYTSTKFYKEMLNPIDVQHLTRLKPGEISDSYRAYDSRGNQLSKVVKLIEVIPSHSANLNEDYLVIEEIALMDKQEKAFMQWLERKIGSMFIRVEPAFRFNDFENKAWLK